MKKSISLLAIAFMAFTINTVKAQTPSASVMPTTSASYSNTGADTATFKSVGSLSNITIQPIITKVSGTVAGKAFVWVSLDGINYVKLTTDSLVLSDQTVNTKIFSVGTSKYLYYRVITTGSGTMGASFKSWFLGK